MVYCVAWKLWDHFTGKLRFQFTRELKPATERQGWRLKSTNGYTIVLGYGLLRCLEVMGPPHRKAKIPIHQRAETCHRKTRLAAEVHQFCDIPLSSDMVYCVAWKLWDHLTGKLRFQFTRELKPVTERQGWRLKSTNFVIYHCPRIWFTALPGSYGTTSQES